MSLRHALYVLPVISLLSFSASAALAERSYVQGPDGSIQVHVGKRGSANESIHVVRPNPAGVVFGAPAIPPDYKEIYPGTYVRPEPATP